MSAKNLTLNDKITFKDAVEYYRRKLVPEGSIAIARVLVAGLDVCLQNQLPIVSLRQSITVDQAD